MPEYAKVNVLVEIPDDLGTEGLRGLHELLDKLRGVSEGALVGNDMMNTGDSSSIHLTSSAYRNTRRAYFPTITFRPRPKAEESVTVAPPGMIKIESAMGVAPAKKKQPRKRARK